MGIDKVNGAVEVYVLNKIVEAQKESESLNLSFCNLVSLPETLFQLTHLKTLNLQRNYQTFLPERINQFTNLQELNLELNNLETLPPEIGQLGNLRKLDIKNNQLEALPPEIGQLTNLMELDLRGNKLTSLPAEITELANLKHIYLQGNPLERPPLEIAVKGIEAIRNYFNPQKSRKEVLSLPEKPSFNWNYNQNLHFEYHYQRMLNTLWSNFVKKQQRQNRIENDNFWENGVILLHRQTKALIQLESPLFKVKISIDGPDKRELLGMIRRDLSEIHELFSDCDIREMVPCICEQCRKEPEVFHYETLKNHLANGQRTTQCAKSGEDVSIITMLKEIDDLLTFGEGDLFEGWRPENIDQIKLIIYGSQVLVIHDSQQTNSKYNYEQLNQIIHEIIRKKIHSETEIRNMIENLNIIKNRSADKAKRQIAAGLFKILITYLLNNGEQVLAGFLYESIRSLPYLV